MKFLIYLNALKEQFNGDCSIRKNGTLLLHPGKNPNSKHLLFSPLKNEYIEDYLISDYANEFPEEYIEFLKYSNGAVLYTVMLKTESFQFAHPLFVIFGLPLTSPFSRPIDMEEPFDVRVEDLARHKDIPKSWLKCGTYIKDYNFNVTCDIFIDTVTNKVYSCVKNEKDIIDSWNNLDECFCSIFESFADCELEYAY